MRSARRAFLSVAAVILVVWVILVPMAIARIADAQSVNDAAESRMYAERIARIAATDLSGQSPRRDIELENARAELSLRSSMLGLSSSRLLDRYLNAAGALARDGGANPSAARTVLQSRGRVIGLLVGTLTPRTRQLADAMKTLALGFVLSTLLLIVGAYGILRQTLVPLGRRLDASETERKEADKVRLATEERFRLMVESVQDYAILMLDAQGNVATWNAGAQRFKGYRAEEIMGRHFSTFYPPEDVAAGKPERELEIAAAEGPLEDEGWRVRKDGTRFWANVVITAVRDSSGNHRGFAKLVRDLTERRGVEAQLNEAKAIAEAANLAKSEFLSSMSHELRTPLNAILGFAQLMATDVPAPTPNQKASIDQVLQAGWYLLELINEVLDLSLIESGKLTLSPEPVSISEILSDCHAMMSPLAQKRGIALKFPTFDQPSFVMADRTRLQQVFVNLLSNAIKYNRPNGSIVVECTARPDGRIRTSVTDTGVGLTQEKLAQLYQPFNRLGQEVGVEQGTGIGLVVTKRLVEAMRGTVGVESTVDVGTKFWVDFVGAALALTDLTDVSSAASSGVHSNDTAPMRTVLYVEDNPANLKLVEMLFVRRGDLRLLSAGTGDLGIELARAHLPDVILMDINLPGTNGVKALAVLRREALTAHIPVIALSANASPRDIERGMTAGFFRYLTKPIKVDELLDTLDLALAVASGPHLLVPRAA